MPRYKGAHLTWNDRLTIEKMLREGYSKPQIARYLGVHHSTVYDECRRGAVELKRSDLTISPTPPMLPRTTTWTARRTWKSL